MNVQGVFKRSVEIKRSSLEMETLPKYFTDKNVCILGMGYVGLTLAVAMGRVGFNVHGLEVRDDVLSKLRQGKAHFWERNLDEHLQQVIADRKLTTLKELDASVDVSVYIITVGTPLDNNGSARLDMIKRATEQIAEHIDDGALIILRSTVMIGTARKVISPILEQTGKKFDIAVCPERTLEGQALAELNSLPQVIGADSQDVLFRAGKVFNFLTPTTVRVSSLESAEVVKLIDNTYRDVMFGFANEVARVCDAVGISAQEVIQSGKLGYERTNVALPGPVGGPCLEKDPHILVESAKVYGIDLDIAPASRRVNENQPLEVVNFIKEVSGRINKSNDLLVITLLGIAFKGVPETNDLRGTMAKPILHCLENEFPRATIRGYDPVVHEENIRDFGLIPVNNIDDAFSGSDIVMILNNHVMLGSMSLEKQSFLMNEGGVIYDLWNLYNKRDVQLSNDVEYYGLGTQKI